MKISFSKGMEESANSVNGMKVPYGPAKRRTPRLRWYLILLAVTSPIIVFAANFVYGLLHARCDGYVVSTTQEILAMYDGFVDTVYATTESPIDSGAPVIKVLPSARTGTSASVSVLSDMPSLAAKRIWEVRANLAQVEVDRAKSRLDEMLYLQTQQAATTPEVDVVRRRYSEALDAMEALHLARHSFDRKPSQGQNPEENADIPNQKERYRAPWPAKMISLRAMQGQFVRKGDRLLTLEKTPVQYKIIAMLQPKFIRFAKSNLECTIKFPDGTRARAKINEVGKEVETKYETPAGLIVLPFSRLVITLSPLDSLKNTQKITGMPVTVSFWKHER